MKAQNLLLIEKNILNTLNMPLKKQPLISVGLASYNRPELLDRAITSLIKQDYLNLEILISDNGSTDERVLKKIKDLEKSDSRVKTFFEQQNKGPFFNFRLLLEKATGEYFIWLADDDYWGDDFLSNILTCAYTSGASLTYGKAVGVDSSNLISDEVLKEMNTNLKISSSLVSFAFFDSDSIFYGLFKTQEGQKLISLLKEWYIPTFISDKFPFLSYNFPSYAFIYGLLSKGGFYNASIYNVVHYVGGRPPYKNTSQINKNHILLMIGYVFMHAQMTFRYLKSAMIARSWSSFFIAPLSVLYLFSRRFSIALINRRKRFKTSIK